MSEGSDFTGVVVAAGQSARFGGDLPKQFALLAGRTLVERSIAAISGRPDVRGVVVVLDPAEIGGPRATALRGLGGVEAVVAGGRSRASSVRRGLASVRSPFVLVHDAARPLAPPALVDAVIAATRRDGAAVPGLEVRDTVKQLDPGNRVAATLDRSRLRLAQTPQGARVEWLAAALEGAERDGAEVTDEAAALERAGHAVTVVPGDPGNVKITTREDLERVRDRLEGRPAELRVGAGFDIHRVAASRPLVLGGVRFPGEPGLAGHSDADVLLHAAMDALLGAAGIGDIGALFPPDDSRFAGADSAALAAEVAQRLAAEGLELVNLDLTLLAERPRIRSRAEEMRRSIGRCLGVEPSRIGLKATTLERLGALGRREGIAAQAVALLRRRPDA